MEPVNRILVNTLAQYVKAVISLGLQLYSTRLILDALQVSDYGIYSLVGGMVAMLGFINNALVITTQRYISFYHGSGDQEKVKKVFVNSLLLHIVIAVLLGAILFVIGNWLVYSVLNIPPARLETAWYVYNFATAMLVLTILTAPFKAVFIANENIVFIAVIEVLDAIVKLLLAVWLTYSSYDKLLFYATMMTVIIATNLVVFSIYGALRFDECILRIRRRDVSRYYLSKLTGFAGWTTYGMGAVAGRNQGTAIILNHFVGTAINAAYGIAFQIYGAIAFIVTSIMNAMNPQIMKSEGSNEREHMLTLGFKESKYSSILLSMVAIPLVFEIQPLLDLWLKTPPEHAAMFCRFILVAFIGDQMTMGLQTVIQAMGHIRNYTLLIYTPKIIYLPIAWLMLRYTDSVVSVMWFFLIVEFLVAMLRIPYLKQRTGLSIRRFVSKVVLPLFAVCTVLCIVCLACVRLLSAHPLRFVVTFTLAVAFGLVATWLWGMDKEERTYVLDFSQKWCHGKH